MDPRRGSTTSSRYTVRDSSDPPSRGERTRNQGSTRQNRLTHLPTCSFDKFIRHLYSDKFIRHLYSPSLRMIRLMPTRITAYRSTLSVNVHTSILLLSRL